MHELLRLFTGAKLASDSAVVQRTHAQTFLALSEEAEPELTGPDQVMWLNRLEAEHNNLRTALGWSIENGEAEVGGRLGAALWHFWYMRNYHMEGKDWLERLVALPAPEEYQPHLLYGLGMMTRRSGDTATAVTHMEKCLALYRELGNQEGIASTLRILGFLHFRLSEYETAKEFMEESLELFHVLENEEGTAAVLQNLAYVANKQGDLEIARAYADDSLAMRRRSGNRFGVSLTLNSLIYAAIQQNDLKAALAYVKENLAVCSEIGNKDGLATTLHGRGWLYFAEGNYSQALACYEESRTIAQEIPKKTLLRNLNLDILIQASRLAHTRTLPAQILRLGGFIATFRETGSRNHLGLLHYAEELEHIFLTARQQLDEVGAEAAWAEGKAMTLEAIMTLAESILRTTIAKQPPQLRSDPIK
jgi:tetratricopeptide (TPR) repeat protein